MFLIKTTAQKNSVKNKIDSIAFLKKKLWYFRWRQSAFLITLLFTCNVFVFAEESVFIQLGRESKALEIETSKGQSGRSGRIRTISPGNLEISKIPELPGFTKLYARAFLKGQIEALMTKNPTQFATTLGKKRIPEIMDYLKSNGLLNEAVRLGKIFKIDPIHILGPVIGEFTFNGSIDRYAQDKWAEMFKSSDYQKMNQKMQTYIDQPEIESCMSAEIRNYWKWRCLVARSSATENNSNRDLIGQYYEISRHGTFGIGQVQPFLLWAYADLVHDKIKDYSEFAITDSAKFMAIIKNDKKMLAYIAAIVATSIDVYKQVAQVDISRNVGLTTTLYNLGDEYMRAYYFNLRQQQEPGAEPQVNYMGWYINYFEKEIRSYL